MASNDTRTLAQRAAALRARASKLTEQVGELATYGGYHATTAEFTRGVLADVSQAAATLRDAVVTLEKLHGTLSIVTPKSAPTALVEVTPDVREGEGFMVWYNKEPTSPTFNARGPADAYADALRKGERQPEFSQHPR